LSFLAKIGQVLATVGATALGIGPLVAPLFGSRAGAVAQGITVGVNDLTAIGTVIVQIETALQGKTGADKFAAAVALVGPIITTSQLVSGKKIADAALFQKGVNEVTQGLVDVLNALHADSVKTEVKTA
jgi:hypothetical protein